MATDEVVLHGTIRLDSKIRSQNVHFHGSFWREQTLAVTKLFLSLTRIDFAVLVPITSTRTALIRDLYSYGFPRKLRAGPYGSYDNMYLLTEWEGRTGKYLARGQGVRTERSEVRTS